MNQIKGGIILNYTLIGLNIVLGLLYTPYMLRMLGQNEYGLYSLVASIITYLTLLDFGFGSAIVRYTAKLISENKKREQWELNGMFLCVYSIISIICIGLGIILYTNVDSLFEAKMTLEDVASAKIMIILLILNLALTFPLSVFGSIISAYEDFIFQKILNICRVILTTAVIVILLYFGYKAVAMVVVQTVFNISILIINSIYCFKKLHIKVWFTNFNLTLLREICIFSFWVFLSQIIDRIYWGTGQFILGSLIGTAAVAIFSVAILLQQMYLSFSNSIAAVLLPRLTKLAISKENDREISNLFIKAGRIQCYIMSLLLAGFFLFGNNFISLWAGDEYKESYYVTLIFFSALFIPTVQTTGYTILQARNKMKFRSLSYLVVAVASFIMQIILTKQFGIIGCAAAVGGALFIGQGIVINIYYSKYQNLAIGQFWKEITQILLVPTLLSLLFMLLQPYLKSNNWVTLILEILVFSIIYFSLIYLFCFNKYEKNVINKAFAKISFIKKLKSVD